MAGVRWVRVLLNLSGIFPHGEGTDGSGVVMLRSDFAWASANLSLNTAG